MATPANEDSEIPPPEGSGPPRVQVHTREERETAVATWLLTAADDARFAITQWRDTGGALLHCGTLFSAVCLPDWMVHAAACTSRPDEVSMYLGASLEGGPVFHDVLQARYYALTPASAEFDWDAESTTVLGRQSLLVVPAPTLSTPGDGLMYWSVPMDGPAALCQAGRLAMVAEIGLARAAQREALGGTS